MDDTFAVELIDVTKHFKGAQSGDVQAVNNITLRIGNGEFFSLLGPSGCGKSTTLRMIAGFEIPSSGEVRINGQVMGDIPPHLRPVNMVFQSYALFPHMTVFDNVAFGLKMDGVGKEEIKQRVESALNLVQLSGTGYRRPKQLSGGQQQRVALARALVKRPAVLLLDEPLGALDRKLRKAMQLELKHMQQTLGITFIYVTHDQEEAITMSDRIAVINHGRVLQVGSPVEIYELPSCKFVADFIGESNFMQAAIKVVSRDACIVELEGALHLPLPLPGFPLSEGQTVTIMVRPEKGSLMRQPTSDPAYVSIPGKVLEALYLGNDITYLVSLGETHKVNIRNQNIDSQGEGMFKTGESIQVVWRADHLRILAEE
jgi:spermidine/putrescine transport system ATP-binding protein